MFQDSDKGDSKLQQYSSSGAGFTDDLIKLIQPQIPFKFSIGIHFNKNVPLKKSVKSEVLNRTRDICVTAMINISNHQHVDLENYYAGLPEEIDDIHIYRFDGMEESFDSRPEGGVVATLKWQHIKPILEQKEKKLPNYTRCDKHWLLIREGNYFAGSFSQIEMNLPINSLFDSVLLFRTRSKEIFQLK